MKRFSGVFTCSVLALGLAMPAQSAAIIGAPIVVASDGDVIATYLGSDAGYESQLGLVNGPRNIFDNRTSVAGATYNLGSFTAGTLLTFSLFVVSTGNTFLSGLATANPDLVAHASVDSTLTGTTVGFEDMFGGGDLDYNDLQFSFTNTTTGVPEPASWAMFFGGFALAGAALRRRKVNVSFA